MAYGYELILDLHHCDASLFTRDAIDGWFAAVCKELGLVRCERYWWDDVGVPADEQQQSAHTQGTSAVQFIMEPRNGRTSSIMIHTLDLLGAVYINIFSCKSFEPTVPQNLSFKWFEAMDSTAHFIERT